MGGLANTIFSVLLGWIRDMVGLVWGFFSRPQSSSTVSWFTRSWWAIAVVLILAGTVLDVLVYWLRWRPDRVWISFFRRIGLLPTPQTEEDDLPTAPHPPTRRAVRQPLTEAAPIIEAPQQGTETAIYAPPQTYPMAEQPTVVPNPYELPPAYAPSAETNGNPYARVSVANPYAMPQTYAPTETVLPAEAQEQAAVPAEPQQEKPKDRMGWVRRGLRELPKQLAMAGEEDESIRFTPVQPTVNKDEAYSAPVYPSRMTQTAIAAPQETIAAPKPAPNPPAEEAPRRRRRAARHEGEN